MLHQPISYVSAPCGAGKTFAVIDHIRRNRSQQNFLYIGPSIALLEEFQSILTALEIPSRIITSKSHASHVLAAVMRHLDAPVDCGDVLGITWNAYISLPFRHQYKHRETFIDEVPQVDRFYSWKLPRNADFLMHSVAFVPDPARPALARVIASDIGKLRYKLEQERDDVDELFRPFYLDLLSPYRDVFVNVDAWSQVIGHKSRTRDHELYFVSMLKPKAFRDAVLVGANVKESLLFHWLERQHNCTFSPREDLARRLRSVSYEFGPRLRLSYFLTENRASKYLYSQAYADSTLVDQMDSLACETFGDAPFLCVKNNDRVSILESRPNAIFIPVVSHGLNAYSDFSKIYFSAALNRSPRHYGILNALGLESDCIHSATACEIAYQAIMRTSLRNPNSMEEVHAIVPDQFTALWLQQKIGAKSVEQLGSLKPRPILPLSPTEKSRRQTAKKARHVALNCPENIPRSYLKEIGMNIGTEPNDTASEVGNPVMCDVTFHASVFDNNAQQHKTRTYTVPDFISFLRTQSRAVLLAKEESLLFNATTFAPPEGAQGYRRKDHFAKSSFLILDFDGGELSPEAFASLFWSNAVPNERLSFAIFNTFSRCEEDPNRFRVIIFYKRAAVSIAQHEAIFDEIARRIAAFSPASDLDNICRSGVQSFYLPGTNRNHPHSAFFRCYGCKQRDLARYAIDPNDYVTAGYSLEKVKTALPSRVSDVNQSKIDEITERLRAMSEGRHTEAFKVGYRLATLGLHEAEVDQVLRQVVGPQPHMQRKVPYILRSLRKYGQL